MREQQKFFLMALLILLVSLVIIVNQDHKAIISGRVLDVIITDPLQDEGLETPQWTLTEKIAQARNMLEGVDLFVGEDEITYYEDRIGVDTFGSIYKSNVKLSEEAKEIALALLNTETGDIQIVVIRKEGNVLIHPKDIQIDVVTRPSGIHWNYWNTDYKVTSPENLVVIGNRYPVVHNMTATRRIRNNRGQMVSQKYTQRAIDYVYYVPYSEGIHTQELIETGKTHIRNTVIQAFATLEERGVPSRALSGTDISENGVLKPEFFERLPLLEHSDLGEFIFNPQKAAERVLVIIGANGDEAYKKTCNSSGACGLVQFIASSYDSIRTNNPKAELIKDSAEGRADHVNTMMAAILHHDAVLGRLVDSFSEKILEDKNLEEYLAAGYNGSYIHVISSLQSTLNKTVSDWSKNLKKETLGFIVKLRYIRDNSLI